MKKNDIWIIIIAATVAAVFFLVTHSVSQSGDRVTVTIDGDVTASYVLSEPLEVLLNSADGGRNRLVIQDGEARITEANCPDKQCVHQKAIKKSGESIICLPHKLVITAKTGEAAEFDAIAN